MHITAQNVSASVLVVIDDVFHKILNTHNGFMTKKDTSEILVCLYLCTSIGSITSAFYLKILGQKEQGGVIKLVAVVNIVLNFLITDKRIMAEKSSVPSKRSTTSAFSSKIFVQKGKGE